MDTKTALNSETKSSYTGLREDIVSLVPGSSQKILDVGCSDGTLGAYLRSVSPDRTVFGIEIDETFFQVAKNRLNSAVNADLNRVELIDVYNGEKFDCIVFGDVLEHLENPALQLKYAVDKLEMGGVVVVSMPNIRHVFALYSIFFRGTFPRNDRGLFDRTHLRWFTIADARSLIEGSGLKLENVIYSLRVGDRGDGIPNKILRKLFW